MKNIKRVIDVGNGKGEMIMTHDIKKVYLTSEIFQYLNFISNLKTLGDPWNIGWMNWPCWVNDLMEAC